MRYEFAYVTEVGTNVPRFARSPARRVGDEIFIFLVPVGSRLPARRFALLALSLCMQEIFETNPAVSGENQLFGSAHLGTILFWRKIEPWEPALDNEEHD